MTQIVEKKLQGEPLTNQKYPIDGNQMMFDWRQLKRWSIDEERLPAGSIVHYRKASVWAAHKWKIVGVILIIFTQTFALFGLIVQRRRCSRAEEESQLRIQITPDLLTTTQNFSFKVSR